MGELHIFGNMTYEDCLKQGKTPEEIEQDERKGFSYNGIYVTGMTKRELKKLLDEIGWMVF